MLDLKFQQLLAASYTYFNTDSINCCCRSEKHDENDSHVLDGQKSYPTEHYAQKQLDCAIQYDMLLSVIQQLKPFLSTFPCG